MLLWLQCAWSSYLRAAVITGVKTSMSIKRLRESFVSWPRGRSGAAVDDQPLKAPEPHTVRDLFGELFEYVNMIWTLFLRNIVTNWIWDIVVVFLSVSLHEVRFG